MNRTIRQFFICMAAAFIMALTPFQAETVFAATAKIIFDKIRKPEVETGLTVTVKAAADGNLGGADIVLSYDPAVIELSAEIMPTEARELSGWWEPWTLPVQKALILT